MTRSGIGVRLIGLSALTLGLTALLTSAAQAEVGSNWRVNGVNVDVNSLLPEVTIDEIEKLLGNPLDTTKHGALAMTLTNGTKVEFLCTSITAPGLKLGNLGRVDLGKVTFHGCITKLNGVTSPPCLPRAGGVNDLITTESGEGLIRLHNGEATVLFKPDVGKVLAKILMGDECSIGESVTVEGKVSLRDSGGESGFLVEELRHLFEPSQPLTSLTVLSVNATLNGTALVLLAGPHNCLKWSGKPA